MVNDFDRILDECIEHINRGESLEACLAWYPDHVDQLEPLLQAVIQTKEAYSFEPSMTAKSVTRQRFYAALERLEQRRLEKQPLFTRLFARPIAWATVATVLLIIVAGYFGLSPLLYPAGPVPNPEGNFVFLISDDVNAIDDFASLNVSISKIGLHLGGESGQWVEFEPEVKEVDLTLVQGDKAQEIWRGDVPEGQYNKVFIHVASVSGILKETGASVDVKLPSEKLQISKPFEVTNSSVTSFVYDLTVIATGTPQSGVEYILKPQVGQSGADQGFESIDGKGDDGQHQDHSPNPQS
jgi:hypothetical protein